MKATNIIHEPVPGGAGPYYNPSNGVSFTTAGHKFHVFCCEGYNANGLIGTEYNGLVLLSVTDRQVVFADYMRKGMGNAHINEKIKERDRLLAMTADEFSAFLDSLPKHVRYNPLTAKAITAAKAKQVKRLDGNLAGRAVFKGDGDITAGVKRGIARDWELFIIHRILADPKEFSQTETGANFGPFTDRLYKHMMGYMGYIAHFNRSGFFGEQFARLDDFFNNVSRISRGEDGMGYQFRYDKWQDLHETMQRIAENYLPEVTKLMDARDKADHEARIAGAKTTLEKAGYVIASRVEA